MPQVLTSCSGLRQAAAKSTGYRLKPQFVLNAPPVCRCELAGEGEAVGCLGRVNYPIDAHFEKFIADRRNSFLDTTEPEDRPRLFHILIDPESPFDGEATKELRRVTTAEGLRFFELRLPIRLSRAGGHLTTDNVFDLLAGFRSEDASRTGYTREFPQTADGRLLRFPRPGIKE